jgi:DNA topoisomerase-1
MQLVIVESPTKARTIGKFLGREYTVESSYGHVRDLPKSKIGIDVKKDFKPEYVIPKKAMDQVAILKKLAKTADKVILATDEDREGEAIAWHLVEALDLGGKKTKSGETAEKAAPLRIVFHEITKNAILEAMEKPRAIDLNLVDAQQARRVLDRLVGYELSPFLWRKIRYGLSAGRVQSVAVRLIVEREREIQAFNKEEYWSVEGLFAKKSDRNFPARLTTIEGKAIGKMGLTAGDTSRAIVEEARKQKYSISEIAVKDVTRHPAPPFTTSTLQQEAARKLGYSAKQTMMIAQKLYENGAITYMRTDSVNLAASALAQAREVIKSEFGSEYNLDAPRQYATKSKGAQEAHEAIRPTDLSRRSAGGSATDKGGAKLYDLIWKRTLACQMQSALMESTAADLTSDDKKYIFRANGQVVKFDGFIRAYTEGQDEDAEEEIEGTLPALKVGDTVDLEKLDAIQHFTEPPPRYTDASLVKALEAAGVGRPSTYAPTLSTIQEREYVTKIEKRYAPTEIGTVVNDMLVENFPEIVDINFTSHIEEELDSIAEGKIKWTEVCREFYGPFKKHLEEKEATVEKKIELSDVPCPHCGKPMIIKFGRMGKFLACPEPGVKVTLPMPEEAAMIKELEAKTKDERCPICGGPMDVKRGRFGFFLGCVDYPKCKGISKIWNKTGFKCPNCIDSPVRSEKPGDIVEKKSRGRGKPFFACTRWPDCEFLMNKKPESEAELQELYKAWKNAPPKEKGTKGKRPTTRNKSA